MKTVATTALQTVTGRTRMLLVLAQESADEERAAQEEVNQEAGAAAKEEVDEEEGAAQGSGPATATGLLGRAAPHSPDPPPSTP